MNFLVRLLINAAIAYGISFLFKDHIHFSNYGAALVFVLLLGLLNVIVKPILVLLTLPVTILTLGLFLLVLNVLMIIFADKLLDSVQIDGFWWACVFGLFLSVISSLITRPGREK